MDGALACLIDDCQIKDLTANHDQPQLFNHSYSMTLDVTHLKEILCDRLCADVQIHERHDGTLMLNSPFTFPDGDHYLIYISESSTGGVVLSDRGTHANAL